MSEKKYSLDALNRFFDSAASRGLLKRNTAQSRKIATNKILAVLDENECSDLRTINLDQAFDRFQNLNSMDYKPESLQIYLSRAKTALTDFIAYVDNPSSYKASSPQRSVAKPKNDRKNNPDARRNIERQEGTSSALNETNEHLDIRHIIVPVPLRENLTVKISNLPADLTQAEAERLAAIVRAYAVPVVK